MNLKQLLDWKKGNLDEYQRLLKRLDKVDRKIRRASDRMYDEESSISVFASGCRDERDYVLLATHKEALEKAKRQLAEAKTAAEALRKEIKENFLETG